MIAPQPFYSDRGTPMNVKLIASALGEAGHFVDLLVFPTGRTVELTNVRIVRIPNFLGVKKIPVGPSFCQSSILKQKKTAFRIKNRVERY